MTEIKVDNVQNAAGSGKPNFPVSPTHSAGSALSTLNTYCISSGTEPSSPKMELVVDSDNDKVMVYIAGEFKEIELNASSGAAFTWGGDRGVFASGYANGNFQNTIDYINLTSAGNATDFGDTTETRNGARATGSSTRFVTGTGYTGSGYSQNLDYITTATTGNASDFGDHTHTGISGLKMVLYQAAQEVI